MLIILFVIICAITIFFIILHEYRHIIFYYLKKPIRKWKVSKNTNDFYDATIITRNLKDNEIRWYIDYVDRNLKLLGYKRNGEFALNPYLKSRLKISKVDEKFLKDVMDDIFHHMGMGLDTRMITLEVNRISDESKHAAGLYYRGSKKISININEGYSVDNVIAVLIHECTHHFLFSKNIRLEDVDQNEYLTDLTTVYLGFGKYMYRGYKDRSILKSKRK